MRVHVALLVGLSALMLSEATAQSAQKPPKRPRVSEYADSNDANAYWRYGISKVAEDPWDADDAFWWATEIDPTWAEGYYGRWVAKILEDPRRIAELAEGDEGGAGTAELRQIDSLYAHALTLNPFLYEKLKRTMMEQEIIRSMSGGARGAVDLMLQRAWKADPYHRAIDAYTHGDFPLALASYDTMMIDIDSVRIRLQKKKGKEREIQVASYSIAKFHLERGRIFYLAGNSESAAVELANASRGLQTVDQKLMMRVYESKAIVEQSIGLNFERLHLPDSAREAYGRALQEDLSYAPAHLALSYLALAHGDTAQALGEIDLAAQMMPNDPGTAFVYGRALILSGHDQEAVTQLKLAVKLDPYFAMPHALLAFLYDASSYEAEALAEYRAYLSLAPAAGQYVAKAKERVTALTASTTANHADKP